MDMKSLSPSPGVVLRRLAAGSALLLLAAAPLSGQPSAPRSPDKTVTGDLVVKFRDASEPGAALSAVVDGSRTIGSAAPVAARLSNELGVPLILVQVTSGREALLAVDRKALLESMAQRARREPGVASAKAIPPPATILPGEQISLRIELKPQASAQALAGKLASGPLLRPQLQTVGGATLLSIDMLALTRSLLEQLKQRSDVEYAQANLVLRAIGATPPR